MEFKAIVYIGVSKGMLEKIELFNLSLLRFFDTYANDARSPVAGPYPTPAAQSLPLIIPT